MAVAHALRLGALQSPPKAALQSAIIPALRRQPGQAGFPVPTPWQSSWSSRFSHCGTAEHPDESKRQSAPHCNVPATKSSGIVVQSFPPRLPPSQSSRSASIVPLPHVLQSLGSKAHEAVQARSPNRKPPGMTRSPCPLDLRRRTPRRGRRRHRSRTGDTRRHRRSTPGNVAFRYESPVTRSSRLPDRPSGSPNRNRSPLPSR